MSLVKVDGSKKLSSWSNRDGRATSHRIPGHVPTPVIDYDNLKALCSIEGLADRKNPQSSEEAHRHFMENYHKMFVAKEKKSGFPVHSINRSMQKMSVSSSSIGSLTANSETASEDRPPPPSKPENTPDESHDIRDHLPLLHKQRKSEKPEAVQADRIRTLRRLLRKLPFERHAEENEQIYNIVKKITLLPRQVSPHVLKELCVLAQLDHWREEDITVFGNTGFHLILRGSVKAQTLPYKRDIGEPVMMECPTPVPESESEWQQLPVLKVGASFGTLDKIENREPNSRVLTALTLEPNCEFLKISGSDYTRVVEQIRNRDEAEKVNLLQSCKAYKMWSKQPLAKVACLLEYTSFPANTVLVSEGYKSPFLAIIKSGECHVLRQLQVLKTLANGKKERRTRQVVMGKLQTHDTFGEISVILDEPMTCTILTASKLELAVVDPSKLDQLDDVTLQLLQQSSERTYGSLTEEDIHEEYIKQELKREWNEFKHSAVVEVINSKGVRPGYGKWAK